MIDIQSNCVKTTLPFKSVAGALWFSVLLGPVGLLYSNVIGGSILIFLSFLAVSNKLFTAFAIFWLVSCIFSVIATNRYNKKILLALQSQ